MLLFGPRSGGGWLVRSQDGALRWPVWAGNILLESPTPQAGGTVVCWSGWLDDRARPLSGYFQHDPRVWSGPGWEALSRRMAELLPLYEAAGARLLIRPHVRHVVSDVPTVRRLLGQFESPALGIFLEPAAMLTAAMADDARDHLGRILWALAGHERTAAILMSGAERPAMGAGEPDHDDLLVPAPLTRGALDYHDLRQLLREHGRFERPMALVDEDLGAQLDMLREVGVLPSGSPVG